ncbi:AraC family transcriptional regulator [Aquincola sp. S2]|uniref:AraC family transcriptional regulator n=1 Tax=Pseudaquabacterium terrae TaxID=2732868 RepID=A0ABX2E931_9BURK|nr:AraC family transcriptional regulator [Aquabacterium terrae]
MNPSAAASHLTRWPLPGGQALEVLVSSEPERRFAPHWHAEWSIGAVLEGRCRFACAGRAQVAEAGDLVVMPPFALHTAGVGAQAFRMAMVYAPHDWLADRLGWPRDRAPGIATVTHDAAAAAALGDAAQHAAAQPLIEVVLATVGRLAGAPSAAWQPPAVTHDARIEQLCRVLQAADDAGTIDLRVLAAQVGVSREHLHRLFRSALGLSPLAYARLARIARAKTLLGEGHAAASVAADCGFADQAHFSRWFRRCFGVTPSRYLAGA